MTMNATRQISQCLCRGVWASLLLLLAVAPVFGLEAGDEAPDFEVRALDGEVRQLSDYAGKLVVLEWTHYGCPFVAKLYESGKIPKLQKKSSDRGVIWLVIASGLSADQEKLNSHEFAKLRKVDGVLLDPSGALAKAYGTRTAPHFYVIAPDGKIGFEGAADDNRSSSVETAMEGQDFLAAAIDAVLAGEQPEVQAAKPYGCAVKYAEH